MLPEPPAPTRSQPSPRQAHRAEFSMRNGAPPRGAGEPPPESSGLSYSTQDLGSEGKCCPEARTDLGNPLGPHLTGAALAHPDMGLAARYLASPLRPVAPQWCWPCLSVQGRRWVGEAELRRWMDRDAHQRPKRKEAGRVLTSAQRDLQDPNGAGPSSAKKEQN